MYRRRVATVVAVTAASIGVVIVAALAAGRVVSSASASPGISWRGTPVKLGTRMFTGGNVRIVQAWLLAKRGGLAFYRLERSDGRNCFATGKAADFLRRINAFACSDRFPETQPLLDLSVIGADRPETSLRVIALIGFAADSVASVGAVDDAGQIVARTPVVHNVYMLHLGEDTRAKRVQAFGDSGAPLGAPR